MPWAEMASRGFELPARSRPFLVCCGEDSFEEVRDWFATRAKAWQATVVPATRTLLDLAPEVGPSPPGRFLFSPSPLLQEAMSRLEEIQISCAPKEPRALDVGCGSGREALALATAGWEVTALDRDRRGLDRLCRLAERQGCRDRCRVLRCTLEAEGDLLASLKEPCETFQLVMVNRHLHRPTLREMAELLGPGGLLLFHTFMEGCVHPSDPAHVLKPGELRRIFEGLEVERDEELPGEDGRPMSFFIARKPA